MRGKETVELFLLDIEGSMMPAEAADFAGVNRRIGRARASGKLPRSYTGRPWSPGKSP